MIKHKPTQMALKKNIKIKNIKKNIKIKNIKKNIKIKNKNV